MPPTDLTGRRFGRLLVLNRGCREGQTYWVAACDCGNVMSFQRCNLQSGLTRSCGCRRRDAQWERRARERAA